MFKSYCYATLILFFRMFADEYINQVRQRSNRSSTPSSCSTLTGSGTAAAVAALNAGGQQQQQPMSSVTTTTLSSPDIIKSVTRNLTPPVPPPTGSSPPSVVEPMSDAGWQPGRPKRTADSAKRRTLDLKQDTPPPSGKPPIFPSSPPPTNDASMPPFMREFVARRSSRGQSIESFNPNEPAPFKRQQSMPAKAAKASQPPAPRPHSAFIPDRKLSFENSDKPVAPARRKSDFVARYENLMNRAQAAMKTVEKLDPNQGSDKEENDEEDEEVKDIDFNEEEVLQRCRDFLHDYDKSKRQRAPVPKPRTILPEQTPPKPSIRMRSSSLTLHDKRDDQEDKSKSPTSHNNEPRVHQSRLRSSSQHTTLPKPILKKSSEDLMRVSAVSTESIEVKQPVPILKHQSKDDSKQKETTSKPDHVRIRSPSPDFDDYLPKPILRSRNNSVGGLSGDEGRSSPEIVKSILKRRLSAEDLDASGAYGGDMSAGTSGATSRSSPEPPQGILKQRKWSVGSGGDSPAEVAANTLQNSGSGVGISGALLSSILKKRSNSSQHSSHAGSLEDLSGSSWHEGVKSILKKSYAAGGSTDDDLDEDKPKPRRSILKSRRSEESLSPLSDPSGGLDHVSGVCSGGAATPVDFIETGAESSSSSKSPAIKPILKSSRDKSGSPTRGSTSTRSTSPLE